MGQQDFKVIGKRDENDTLEDITLTRSILLNDLTQTQLKRLYRRGSILWAYFFFGVKLLYKCVWEGGEIILNVEMVHFDKTNGNVVFECGYSLDMDKYFKVLLYQNTDGKYVLSPRILDTEWLKESDLKTINGESIVGTGDIEIKGGSDGNVITILYGKEDRNIEAYKLLYNYTGANNAVSVNLQYSLWLYAATNIWTSVSEKRIYFDIFLLGSLSNRQLSYSRFYLTEDGTCSMESNTLLKIPTLMGEDVSDIRLKSINGESIVGDGNITVGGGGAAAYVYFRLENSSSISDWNDNLGECGIYMEGFLDSNEALTTTLSCYCKVQENNTYQLVPFSIRRDENGDFHIYLTAYCYSEWRRYDISASSWENLRYSPTINYTTIN